MNLLSSPAAGKARSERWIVGAMIVIVLAGVVGLLLLRHARARREAIAQLQMKTGSPTAAEDAVAARALVNYLARIRAQVRDHDVAFARLQQQRALAWNIHERPDIERDRKIVRDFQNANTRLADSLLHGKSFILAELETAKVSAAARDSALALYAKSQEPLLPLHMHVRHCDQMIGENAMAVLDLLDFNWGEWSRDAATGRLDFTNTVTLGVFKDYVGKIESAANERKGAEEELINYQKRHPAL